MSLFTRIVILALASVSLNLIMGYRRHGELRPCGLSGHRRLRGRHPGQGGHHVAASCSGRSRCWLSGLFALGVGALSLRTRGVYFIMITLAFAQMIYYVAIGLDRYGGDDGLTIRTRSQFDGLINLGNRVVFYYFCFAVLLAATYFTWRLVNSRFGMVIQGARSNDRRMRAIGFPTYRYRLVCFVIAGVMCGLAGVLLANHTEFISPATMHWTRSGDLIVMVVLGGMASTLRSADGRGRAAGAGRGAAAADQPFATHPFLGDGATRVARILADRARAAVPAGRAVARGGIDGLFERARRG